MEHIQINAIEQNIDNWNTVNQRCYDHQADYWDRFPFPDLLPFFIQHYHQANLGNKVLDIGSGTGVLAKWMQEQGFDPLCLDPSEEMVTRCRLKGLTTYHTTIQKYQSNESFAMVLAILSLIHVPKQQFPEQLRKIASLLPSGGILFLAMIEGQTEGIDEINRPYPRYFSYYTKQEILSLTNPYFELLDFRSIRHSPAYLIFVLKKL